MTQIVDFLPPERVLLNVRARDKAHLIAEVGRQFGQALPTIGADTIAMALMAREGLGSTGLGGGFALPHARIPGVSRFEGLFLRLARPVAFDAIDDQPVTLVFALLIPAVEDISHVGALAAISRCFRDAAMVERLRQAKAPADAYVILTG